MPTVLAEKTFTATSEDWVVPTGVTWVRYFLIAGGGSGSNGSSSTVQGGIGGDGGWVARGILTVTPGETLVVKVGIGGVAPASAGNGFGGGNGGPTFVQRSGTVVIQAPGGKGGQQAGTDPGYGARVTRPAMNFPGATFGGWGGLGNVQTATVEAGKPGMSGIDGYAGGGGGGCNQNNMVAGQGQHGGGNGGSNPLPPTTGVDGTGGGGGGGSSNTANDSGRGANGGSGFARFEYAVVT